MPTRIAVILAWSALFVWGMGWSGLYWGPISFGVVAFLWYLVSDTLHVIKKGVQGLAGTHVTNYNLNVEEPAIRGERINPDPTGPEIYPAVIEGRRYK
jgi:hypothetical protein